MVTTVGNLCSLKKRGCQSQYSCAFEDDVQELETTCVVGSVVSRQDLGLSRKEEQKERQQFSALSCCSNERLHLDNCGYGSKEGLGLPKGQISFRRNKSYGDKTRRPTRLLTGVLRKSVCNIIMTDRGRRRAPWVASGNANKLFGKTGFDEKSMELGWV
ncbi:hypothetical protein BDV11DRAFT_94550 [Aspergillus similis]